MLSVDQALAAILDAVEPFEPTRIPLWDALGLALAEDVVSRIDSPPFDKSLMDGFAVRSIDLGGRRASLRVIEEVAAGQVPSQRLGQGEATRIMTGAPLPDGADAVVRVEDTRFDSTAGTVTVIVDAIEPGANLMRRGTAMKAGERILPAGRSLQPQHLGALAETGQAEILVRRRPRAAVLATGDELVPVEQTPKRGQIRNSNETMLAAQIRRAGGEAVPLGIARDDRTHLGEKINVGLQSDVLLLSGGVSAGKLDLVPSALQEANVKQVFHKVHVKPGKPIWYGVLETGDNTVQGNRPMRHHVFGLPGNPVSSLVCFELFVRTALRRLMGFENPGPRPIRARLATEHIAHGDRPTYHPARLEWRESGPVVEPVRWHGSADLRATAVADSMVLFPAAKKSYAAGEFLDVFPWGDCQS